MKLKEKIRKHRTEIIIIIAILALLLFLIFLKYGKVNAAEPAAWDLSVDAGSRPGNIPSMSEDDVRSELSEKLAEGLMNISMNTNPVFGSGTSEGNVLIYNDESNRHPQIVEIRLSETGEVVYRSGLCPVGNSIENGKLLTDLSAGDYPCVAYFYAIDEETAKAVGRAGAEVTITVLH